MAKTFVCPVCGTDGLDGEGTHDTCLMCGWSDDWYQRENPDDTNENCELTLNEAKRRWAAGEALFAWRTHPNSTKQ